MCFLTVSRKPCLETQPRSILQTQLLAHCLGALSENDYIYRRICGGIPFQENYAFSGWSTPDPNQFLKYVIFCVSSMAQQNYIFGSRGSAKCAIKLHTLWHKIIAYEKLFWNNYFWKITNFTRNFWIKSFFPGDFESAHSLENYEK